MKREEVEELDAVQFCQIDEDELESGDDFAKYIWSLINNPNVIYREYDNSVIWAEIKHLVERIGNLRIEVRSNEHAPPHFHVLGDGLDASFTIENCELLAGDIKKAHRGKIEWAFRNTKLKDKLIKDWNKTRPDGCPVGKYQEN